MCLEGDSNEPRNLSEQNGPLSWAAESLLCWDSLYKDQGGDVNLSQALHPHGCRGSASAHCEPHCLFMTQDHEVRYCLSLEPGTWEATRQVCVSAMTTLIAAHFSITILFTLYTAPPLPATGTNPPSTQFPLGNPPQLSPLMDG